MWADIHDCFIPVTWVDAEEKEANICYYFKLNNQIIYILIRNHIKMKFTAGHRVHYTKYLKKKKIILRNFSFA